MARSQTDLLTNTSLSCTNTRSTRADITSDKQVGHDHTPPFRNDSRLKLAFTALVLLTLMVSMNEAVLAVALPSISKDLGGTTLTSFWTGTVFLLTEATFMVPLGSLSKSFGRRQILTFSTCCFLLGTIISCAANSFGLLILGRGITGVGGGGIVVCIEIVVTDLVPLQHRGKYLSIISALWAIGDTFGPLIGGVLSYHAHWRAIFIISLPMAVVSLVLIHFFIRLEPVPGTFFQKVNRVDWGGTALLVASVTGLLLAISWGGDMYPWLAVETIAPILAGSIGLIIFYLYEKRVPSEPIIRFELLGNYNMLYSLASSFFHTLIEIVLLFGLPLYFEAVKDFTPLMSGVSLIPLGLSISPFAAVGAYIVSKTGNISWTLRAGSAITLLGTGLLVTLDADTPTYQWTTVMVCAGIGLGLLYNSLDLLCQASTEERHTDCAVTMLNFFRHLGQAAGVAIFGSILQNQMRSKMLAIPALAPHADEYASHASATVEDLRTMTDSALERDIAQVYAQSLQTIYIVMCACFVLPFLGSIFVRTGAADMNREHQTSQGLQVARSTSTFVDKEKALQSPTASMKREISGSTL